MTWTCQYCTYIHDGPTSDGFLACQVCGSPRQNNHSPPTEEKGSANVDKGDDGPFALAPVSGLPHGAEPSTSSSSAQKKPRKMGVATTTTTTAIDLTHSSSDEEGDEAGGSISAPTSHVASVAAGSPRTQTTSATTTSHPQWPPPTTESQTPNPSLITYLSSASSSSSSHAAALTSQPPHAIFVYRQTDRWSCGYRNFQLLLSYLMHTPLAPHIVQGGLGTPSSTVASIRSIQQSIQRAWDAGYDPDGIHDAHRDKLIGTNRWIGTPDVATALRFIGIQLEIVAWSDDRKEDDRSRWPNGCQSATECMMNFVGEYFRMEHMASSRKWKGTDCLPPLYVQRRGHSITCVGILDTTDDPYPKLLICDPAKNGGRVEEVPGSRMIGTSAWEVGYVNGMDTLKVGDGKRIEGCIPD